MSQDIGGIENTQNLNLNVSGAEQVAGATALLTDLSGALKQLLSNPLSGGYIMRRIATGLETAFVNPMKKAANFTKAQQVEFDKLVLKSKNLATVTGAIAGMTLGMVELIRQTKLASTQMGQFMSLGQLPGGTDNFYQAQLDMQLDFIGKSLEYNSQYGEDYANMKKDLFRKLAADLTPEGMSEEDGAKFIQGIEPRINALVEQLTTLQSASGVSVTGFMRLRDELKSFGVDAEEVTDLYRSLTSEVIAGDELKSMSGREVTETFASGLLQYKKQGTAAPVAIDQILNIMENYEPMTGVNELQGLIGMVPKFQNDLQTNMLARNIIPGITQESISGPEGGTHLINTLAKQIHRLSGQGQSPKNIMELWSKNAGGVEKLKALGITPELIQTLNNLKEIKDVSTDISDNFRNMKYGNDFIKTTKTIQDALDATSQKGTSGLFETGENLVKGFTTYSQQLLDDVGVDIDPRIMTGATIVGSGLIMRKLTKNLMKKIPKILGTATETVIPTVTNTVGEGFVPWGSETGTVGKTTGTVGRTSGLLGKTTGKVGRTLSRGLRGGGKVLGTAGALLSAGIEIADLVDMFDQGMSFGDVNKLKMIENQRSGPTTLGGVGDIGEFLFGDVLGLPTGGKMMEGAARQSIIDMEMERIKNKEMTQGEFQERMPYFQRLMGDDMLKEVMSSTYLGNITPENMMMPAHDVKTKDDLLAKDVAKEDLPNLNIIIMNAAGDVLANETLQDAVKQGAISIVMEGIVGVTG